MSQQMWTAVDASYDAHQHLQHWWSTLGTEVPQKTHTERVFNNFKTNLKSMWKENVMTTNLHNKLHRKLKVTGKNRNTETVQKEETRNGARTVL